MPRMLASESYDLSDHTCPNRVSRRIANCPCSACSLLQLRRRFLPAKKRRHLGADRPKEHEKAKKQSVGATAEVDVNATSCQTDDASITFL